MTAIVLGNGKSLNDWPDLTYTLHLFWGTLPIFGCNYVYLADLQPTHYVCIDEGALKNHAVDIYPVASRAKVFYTSGLWRSRAGEYEGLERLYALKNVVFADEVLPRWLGEKGTFGGTAVYVSLKAAAVMGIKVAYLLGVDHEPAWEHFTPDYPRPFDPDRGGMEHHFRIAAAHFRAAGGGVINLSAPSALDEIFERSPVWDTRNRRTGDISYEPRRDW